MQTFSQIGQCILAVAVVSGSVSCNRQESFETATAKHHLSSVTHVSKTETGLPFYMTSTLNPTWDSAKPSELVSVPAFKLVDQDGKVQTEALFDHKITVVGFMFTSCQGFCPFVVEGMKAIEREYRGKAQFVALSVDPENDTVSQLKAYAKRHGLNSTDWHLLTGDKETIYSLAKRTFASQAFKKPSKEPNFIHSEHLYVVDDDRMLRGILNGTRVDVKKEARPILDQLQKLRRVTRVLNPDSKI